MKFKPVDLDNFQITAWPEGAYKFQVEDASEVNGQYGEQLELKLKLKDAASNTKTLKTWINPSSPALGFFCQSVGLLEKYNRGEILDGDCVQKVGYCQLIIKDKFNKVARYLTKSEYEEELKKSTEKFVQEMDIKEDFINEDIPF